MPKLKVTTTREIIVPRGTRQIVSDDNNWVSFVIKKLDSIKYYTKHIDDLPSEIMLDDFIRINAVELKAINKLLKL